MAKPTLIRNTLLVAAIVASAYAEIPVEGLGEGVVLTGTVANAAESQTAFDLAARLVESNTRVVNSITIQNRDQVMLKVTVAEVQRDVIKQLGIDLNGTIGGGTTVLKFNEANPFSVIGQALVPANQI